MTPLKTRILAGMMFAALGLGMSGAASAGEIKQDMKVMKKNIKGALSSNSIEEISGYVSAFENQVNQAANLNFDGTAAENDTYHQGLKQLQNQFGAVDNAIRNNDLDGAKNALENMLHTEKEFHKKFDV